MVSARLLLQVGGEGTRDVLPRGERAGEGDAELVAHAAEDEIVGVDVARPPDVEGMVRPVQLILYRHIAEGFVELVVLVIDLERDGQPHARLRELHDAVRTLQEEGGALRLAVAEVVARDVAPPVEAEEEGEAGGGGCGESCKSAVCTPVAPSAVRVGIRARAGAGGGVAHGGGDEIVRRHLDAEVFDIEKVVSHPRADGIDCEPDFRVEMMKRHPHLAVPRRGGIVEVGMLRVDGEQVGVAAVCATVNLRHDVGFGVFCCDAAIGKMCSDESVCAGLRIIRSMYLELAVVEANACDIVRIRSHGVEAVGEVAVVPELEFLAIHLVIVPEVLHIAVPGVTAGKVSDVVSLHDALLSLRGVCFIGIYDEVRCEQVEGRSLSLRTLLELAGEFHRVCAVGIDVFHFADDGISGAG